MAKLFTIPRSPRVFNFSPAQAESYYRDLAAKFRRYAGLNRHHCPRDARKAYHLAKVYDCLADACEKAVQS